jgi:hypothetical protein
VGTRNRVHPLGVWGWYNPTPHRFQVKYTLDMAHEREIPHYEGELQKLATEVGCLTYDQTAAFIGYLAEEMTRQSEADAARGRAKLSKELAETAALLLAANEHINEAWRISAPHMTPKERGED